MADDNSARAARAWLFKRSIRHISPTKLAAAAKETGKDFGELIWLIGLLHDGPGVAANIIRQRHMDEAARKLVTPVTPSAAA